MQLHTHRPILWGLLIMFLLGFIWLGWLYIVETPEPLSHAKELIVGDRFVQFLLFDFACFFIWVALWMIDFSCPRHRSPYPWILLGLIAATAMICGFVLAMGRRNHNFEDNTCKTRFNSYT